MDGLLVVDKPAGLTSHDAVARFRRILGERHIGHTGTLDPAATGVLPLVLGRATRLARFLSASDKSYEAVVALGVATDTADASGRPVGTAYTGPFPSADVIESALERFRGAFMQEPPAYSAKKIGGKRSYKLARAASAVSIPTPSLPRPIAVPVVVHQLTLLDVERNLVTIQIDCSAGFYVRSLAHDLGLTLGTGAHLAALRRTRSGEWTIADAITLDAAQRDPHQAAEHVVPMGRMLRDVPSVVLTAEGSRRAVHGRDLGPGDTDPAGGTAIRETGFAGPYIRLIDPAGELLGIAQPAATPGLLHPSVVLV